MAAPASRRVQALPPRADDAAFERSLALQRARREARIERRREQRRARLRFLVLTVALLLLAVFLSLTIRDQIKVLFGL